MARGSSKAAGKKLTKEQVEEVLSRSVQGTSPGEIARIMGVDGLRVSGTIRAAVNSGKIPGGTPSTDPKPPPTGKQFPVAPSKQQGTHPLSPPTQAAAARASAPAAVAPGGAPAASGDGHTWSSDPGGRGGFQHPSQAEKYQVERFAPNNDGLVGSYTKAPDDDEIAMRFGQGNYRVSRLIPGRIPEFREVNISGAYGAPRWPRPGTAGSVTGQPPAAAERPPYGAGRWGGGRPQMPRPGMQDEDDRGDFAPPMRPRRPSFEGRDRDRDYGRDDIQDRYRDLRERERDLHQRSIEPLNQAPQESAVAKAAVENLQKMHEKTIEQMDKERQDRRENGPDSTIRDFYAGQETHNRRVALEDREKAQERLDSERKREEERQEAERKRDSERRKDDEDRQRRWATEQDERHRRDMERIKEERKTLLDLEAKKMDLVREESKAREELLTRQIEENVKRVEEANQSSEARIQEIQEQVQADLKQNRKTAEREEEMRNQTHDLRAQHLDNEHSLKKEMIEIQGEAMKNQNQDDLSKLLSPLLDGVKDVIGKVVELKKFQQASPEDRAAAMAQAPPVHELPPDSVTMAEPVQEAAPQSAPAAPGAPAPAAPAPQAAGVSNMTANKAIQSALDTDVARYILDEWARNLKAGRDPAMFVNTFMEFMKDETPDGAAGRKGCAAFIQIMDTRDWDEMKALLDPSIPKELKPAFELEGAANFYNAFRVMACGSVRDYWAMYLAEKDQQVKAQRAQQQGQQDGGAPAATAPAAEAPPVTEPTAEAEAPSEDEPPPAPPTPPTPPTPPSTGTLPAKPVTQTPPTVNIEDVLPEAPPAKPETPSEGEEPPAKQGAA